MSLSFELETLGGAIKNRKVPDQKVRLEMTKECPREPQNLDRLSDLDLCKWVIEK